MSAALHIEIAAWEAMAVHLTPETPRQHVESQSHDGEHCVVGVVHLPVDLVVDPHCLVVVAPDVALPPPTA